MSTEKPTAFDGVHTHAGAVCRGERSWTSQFNLLNFQFCSLVRFHTNLNFYTLQQNTPLNKGKNRIIVSDYVLRP